MGKKVDKHTKAIAKLIAALDEAASDATVRMKEHVSYFDQVMVIKALAALTARDTRRVPARDPLNPFHSLVVTIMTRHLALMIKEVTEGIIEIEGS